jgi:hypothetical protein
LLRPLIAELLTDLIVIVLPSIPAGLSVAGIAVSNCSACCDAACHRLVWAGGLLGFSIGAVLLVGTIAIPGAVFGFTNQRIKADPDYAALRSTKLKVLATINACLLLVAAVAGHFFLKGIAAGL